MHPLLSPQQRTAARRYLDTAETLARLGGEAFWRQKRVLKLTRGEDEHHLYATVSGSERYQVSLYCADGVWEGSCSCRAATNCKHCCAAIYEALSRKADPALELATARPVEASQTKDDPAYMGPTLETMLGKRLGRALKRDERRSAQVVDELFEKHRRSAMVSISLFDSIRGVQSNWRWESLPVWPAPPHSPKSPWEAWCYVVALFRRQQWTMTPSLLKTIDESELQALVGEWEHAMLVEKWHRWLQTASLQAQEPPELPGEAIPLRLAITRQGIRLEWRRTLEGAFTEMKPTPFRQHLSSGYEGKLPFDEASLPLWRLFALNGAAPFHPHDSVHARHILNAVLRLPGYEGRIVNGNGDPIQRSPVRLEWELSLCESSGRDYRLALQCSQNKKVPLPVPLVIVDGSPSLYITESFIYEGPVLGGLDLTRGSLTLPAKALETQYGIALLERLSIPLPPRIAAMVRTIPLTAVFRCALETHGSEQLIVTLEARDERGCVNAVFDHKGWKNLTAESGCRAPGKKCANDIRLVRFDKRALRPAAKLLEALRVTWQGFGSEYWCKPVGKQFAEQFAAWVASIPADEGIALELDDTLDSLRGNPVTATVTLDLKEAEIDWFDLQIGLDVSDTTLTPAEVRLLLDAKGGYVRLGEKGWRRLQFQLSEEDERQLADIGLSARDLSSKPQRLHALQLAGKKAATRLLPEAYSQMIDRRAEEIRTRVMPPVPSSLQAILRPYQVQGFHFLAYLTENRFGGILADDMGLGKTVQTLAWLLWLRERPDFDGLPSLVVCPKSVTENWVAEAHRFAPGLEVAMVPRGDCTPKKLASLRKKAALLVINYSQLRLIDSLPELEWHAVVLDEAQYIKNPQSQTTQSASLLRAKYRVALSGTPIENRLLDLWSITHFTMPGLLGTRTAFSREYDQRSDALARQRLAARVRPFVMRRTKKEVASDLPERTEEDRLCVMEGEQARLYGAELKRARAALLKIETAAQLDKERFHILTSLLRLRQICCHPALVQQKSATAESAKLAALLDLLEPLMEEGQKVLVFSQFVEMLQLVRREVERRGWPHYMLTGETENRGKLVNEFQQADGGAVFLISLRAGGFGLNLTAASYVVLYDPWWNPAVENQAIDRTHRIGQTNKVMAYRLIAKESIEEKIRLLQQQKNALASDILGEDKFTQALTLDDFRFLLEDQPAP